MKHFQRFFLNKGFFEDILVFRGIGKGALSVWYRNFLYFRQTFTVSLFWAIFEPLLYFLAIGFGLGNYIGEIEGSPYVEFFYPALLSSTAMTVAFFETTYGSFTKLAHQKTFSTILLTPVTAREIVFGEILWGASKSIFSVVCVSLVAGLLGLANVPNLIPSMLILFLASWLFAAMGMMTTSLARNYDSFIYATSGFIVPMTLFSGTYFPLSQLPDWGLVAAYCLPLTHVTTPLRDLLLLRWSNWDWLHVLFLVLLSFVFTNWSIARISRKIQD